MDSVLKDEQRLIARIAAALLIAGLVTGFALGGVMVGRVHADARVIAGAHVSAFLGTAILCAYAWTLPLLQYGAWGRRMLTTTFVVFCVANWLLNFARAFLGVAAVKPTGDPTNDILFILNNVLTAIPSLLAGIAWWRGLRKARA